MKGKSRKAVMILSPKRAAKEIGVKINKSEGNEVQTQATEKL